MKYLISAIENYRVSTVDDVEKLHEELKQDNNFILASFSYKTKYLKSKGEILDEWQLVTVKKIFNDEKEPCSSIDVQYMTSGGF